MLRYRTSANGMERSVIFGGIGLVKYTYICNIEGRLVSARIEMTNANEEFFSFTVTNIARALESVWL